jgi:hypothetical protein
LKLLENVLSWPSVVDELFADLVDDILDDLDVDGARRRSRHFRISQSSDSPNNRIGDFLGKMSERNFSTKDLNGAWKSNSRFCGFERVVGFGRCLRVSELRRERERRERERERGGREKQNKGWNINRFASDYIRGFHVA